VLLRAALPRVLPAKGDVLKIAPVLDIRTIVVTDLDRLMLSHRDGHRTADTGILKLRSRVFDSVQTSLATEPKIAIEGSPKSRPNVIAQMPFECANRRLCLRNYLRVILIFLAVVIRAVVAAAAACL